MTSVEDVMSNWRSEHILSNLNFFSNITIEELMNLSPNELSDDTSQSSIDITLSYHQDDNQSAQYLLKQLQYLLPNANLSLPEEFSKERNAVLDESRIIVPLLSVAYIKTAECLEELNIALCKQRFSSSLVFFPIYLKALPSTPAYLRLLWSLFSCTDKVWTSSSSFINKYVDASLSSSEKCLYVAAHAIAYVLTNQACFQGSFKTLMSIEELSECTLKLRGKKDIDTSNCNPLFFNNK